MTKPQLDFAVRLRRVKMKGGGDFHVLRSKEGADGGIDWRGSLVANAKTIADCSDDRLVCYFVIGVYDDATFRCGYRYEADRCPIPMTLMPSYLAELVRREAIIEPEAERKFNDMFEWQEGA